MKSGVNFLVFLFHLAILFNGGIVPLSVVKYPRTLMLINRLSLIVLIIYIMIWVKIQN